MMGNGKFKSFILGFVAAIILTSSTGVFAQTTKSIEALYNNIKLYVDGKQVTFGQDSSGNTIEPFIYNGTTYLPVRAVGEAVNKKVKWDSKTQSVYLGAIPGEVQFLTDTLEPYKNYYCDIIKLSGTSSFSMGGKSYNNGYILGDYSDRYMLFNLDGKYTEIKGVLGAYSWKYVGQNRKFNIYLDGELYKSILVDNSKLPEEILIPVQGALQLKIESPYEDNGETYIGFGNVIIR